MRLPWEQLSGISRGSAFSETGCALEISGGLTAFVRFHEQAGSNVFLDTSKRHAVQCRPMQDEALVLAKGLLGDETFETPPSLPKDERNAHLQTLLRNGLSTRLMTLVTGIGE